MAEQPTSDSGALDELVAQALDAIEIDGEAGLARVYAAHPQLADALRARIDALRAAGLLELPGDAAPERLGPFKLLEQLGAGGMGVVYRALQEDLGREVALKVIRPEQVFFPGARKRFRREVEIIASLQHPGIVPIHTVGEAGGVPYFAMDLLRGETLNAVLERVAGSEPAKLTGRDLAPSGAVGTYLFDGSWENACARVVAQVAHALDYAHQRGVVHRDIKPSNVLITTGSASRAVLLDFGLAASKSAGDLTRTGTLMGSLRYMAPEQVSGASDSIGPHTDVYSLGATLYELLTLRPVIAGDTQTEILMGVGRGAERRPRELNPRVSRELETVCLTALELEPERRYASAADFARDLEAVLSSRPIEARRASLARRAELFVRRNPMRAAALALGFALVVGGPTLYAWQESRAKTVIAGQRDRAERNSARAREAVDRMLTRIGELDLRFVPQAEPVRRAVLEDAVRLLEEVAADNSDDVSAQHEVARAQARLGSLLTELGRASEAAEAFGKAIASMRALRDAGVADEQLTADLADAQLACADSWITAGNESRAIELLDAASAEFARPGGSVSDRASAMRALQLRGRVLLGAGKLDEARAAFERATRDGDALLAEAPNSRTVQRFVFAAWNELGIALLQRFTPEGQGNAQAEQALTRAIAIGEALVAAAPQDHLVRNELTRTRNNYAGALRRRGDFVGAREVYELALKESEELAASFPSTLKYKLEVATVLNQIGLSHDFERASALAEPYYVRTHQLLEELTDAAPHDARLWHMLGIARENLGAPALARGDVQRTVELLRASIEASARAIELAPDNEEFIGSQLIHCRRLFYTLLDDGRLLEAAEAAETAPRMLPQNYRAWSRAAVLLATAFERLRVDGNVEPEVAEERAVRCGRRAVEMMRKAIELGIPGVSDLRRVKDFSPLHGFEPFEQLAEEIAGAPKPASQ